MGHVAGSALRLDFGQIRGFIAIAGLDGFGRVARRFGEFDGIFGVLPFPVIGHLGEGAGEFAGGGGGRGGVGCVTNRSDVRRDRFHPCLILSIVLSAGLHGEHQGKGK